MLAEAEDMNKIEDENDQAGGGKKKGRSKKGMARRKKKRQRDEDGYETDHQVNYYLIIFHSID